MKNLFIFAKNEIKSYPIKMFAVNTNVMGPRQSSSSGRAAFADWSLQCGKLIMAADSTAPTDRATFDLIEYGLVVVSVPSSIYQVVA